MNNKIGVVIPLYYPTILDIKNIIGLCKSALSKRIGLLSIYLINNGLSPEAESNLTKVINNTGLVILKGSGKNIGFSAGVNLGIKSALEDKCRIIILINQNTKTEASAFKVLADSKYSISSLPLKYKKNGMYYFDLGGKIDLRSGLTSHFEVEEGFSVFPKNPDYVSGALMSVKAEVFKDTGFFDERFFMYFEDADFCLRARRKGFTVGIEKKPIAIHNLISPSKRPYTQNLHLFISGLKFTQKHVDVRYKIKAYVLHVLNFMKITAGFLKK